MAQALHLMNAPEIQREITDPNGRAARLARSALTTSGIIADLTLTAFGRFPDDREILTARQIFHGADRQQAVEDFVWVLLNSYEFLFVH